MYLMRQLGVRLVPSLALLLVVVAGAQAAKPVHLVNTYFYDGDMSPHSWSPTTIAVDSDGTVAVAINRSIGAGNAPAAGAAACLILLYDAKGEPMGQLSDFPAGMVDITFGPDHRIYTAEGWFATGMHVYDRPGSANRYVPVRFFKGDGGNVDKGGAQSVAVGPDYRMWDYGSHDKKVHVLSPDDKQLLVLDPPAGASPKINIAPDGTAFMGSHVLQKDNTWAPFKYSVANIRPDGKLLVRIPGGKMGRYDRATDTIEAEYLLPPGKWNDQALGPDDNLYLTPEGERNNGEDVGLAYVVVAPSGKVLLQRGSDFDRLSVDLPDETLAAGSTVNVAASTLTSRSLGYVPHATILPNDNHPELTLRAWLSPVAGDPLADPVWAPLKLNTLPVAAGQIGVAPQWGLDLPAGLYGRYHLRFTAGPVMPGLATLQVVADVTLKPPAAAALLTPTTDRNRTGFLPGEAVRISVAVDADQAVDLSSARLALTLGGKTAWEAPLGLTTLAAGGHGTGVAIVPPAVTRVLRPGVYLAVASGLPVGSGSGQAVVAIVDPVAKSDFVTCAHPAMGDGTTRVADARLHAEMGFRDVVLPMAAAPNFETYLDAASRLGLNVRYQPYTHFAALNSLPEEQGAMRQFFAAAAQRYGAYPALVGINYHDLWAPFGTWWDNVRKDREAEVWKAASAAVPVPPGLTAKQKDDYLTNTASSLLLPEAYAAWGGAIRKVDPKLQVSSEQWWHLDWNYNDPDKASASMDLIATHHMEEQYYHPVTIVSQIEDWRQSGKPVYAYGNSDWQDDGTGGQSFRDIMTSLSRGVQGAGRQELPKAGDVWAERLYRGVIPALKLSQIYGGISAASQPEDQVAVWRSFYENAVVPPKPYTYDSAWWQLSTAINTCLYARRTAGVVTDDKVRHGILQQYKAVIVSLPAPLPPDLIKPLQEFQAHGGIVYANRPTDTYIVPPGAVDLGKLFGRSHADPNGNDDLSRWRDMQDEEGGRLAARLREIMGDKVRPLADCDESGTWLSVLRSGQCRYVCAVNLHLIPQPWEDLHRYIGYENSTYPTKTSVRLNLPPGPLPAIYDVFNGKRVTPRKDGAAWLVEADMSVFPGAILALLPRPIEAIRVDGGQTADKAALRLMARPVDARGGPIDGAVPLHVVLTDPTGAVRCDLSRTARAGKWDEDLPLSASDPTGLWTVTVQELLGGHQVVVSMNVIPPTMPGGAPVAVPRVEWTRLALAAAALKTAKSIAVLVARTQQDAFKPAVDAAIQALSRPGCKVAQVAAEDYLADRVTFGWDKFKFSSYSPATRLRPKQYDLIVTFDTPALPGKVVASDLLAVKPTATDPGPGRALIQFVTMPVFDTEDGLAIQAGDAAGLVLAAISLRQPPAVRAAPLLKQPSLRPLSGKMTTAELPGLRQVVGIPIGQVAAAQDGQRIAVAMKAWGSSLFVLDADGKVLGGDVAGKYFPLDVVAVPDGFWLTSYENDPTCAYWKHNDRDGKATVRLAADGRRFGGARDWSADHPIVERERFRPQASFSVTSDGLFAAVGGSRGVAVWDLAKQSIVWRDDAVHHTVPLNQTSSVTPDASMFPQVKLAPDGSGMVLQHGGKILIRDGRTGQARGEQALPRGAALGRTQVFDGHTLVVGDREFFAFRDGQPLWHWKAPTDVNATAFAADGLHYAIGEPNGTVRILEGGGQIGGYVAPVGGIDSLSMLPDASKVAFSTSGGQVGVLDGAGQVVWQSNVGARAQIAFLGNTGETVVGDWRGVVRRFGTTGQRVWEVDLTPRVYRDDATAILTTPDPTPTLRVPAPADPAAAAVQPLDPARKLAVKSITYVSTSGWHGPVQLTQQAGALIDNKTGGLKWPWFSSGYGPFNDQTCRDGAYWIAGAPAAPAFDLQLPEPASVDTVAVTEDPAHPDSIPQEIKIEAWVNENWQEVVHDLWVSAVTHVHHFAPVTTNKLRYTVMGDLYHNLWTRQIEIYRAG